MPSQRPFFLSSFIAAFRQQAPPNLPQQATSQATKRTTTTAAAAAVSSSASSSSSPSSSSPSASTSLSPTTAAARSIAASSHHPHHQHNHNAHHHSSPQQQQGQAQNGVTHTASIPIQASSRRRGSDSSSEGFREVIGADKWYIGGRTALGEEKFFKLGVVRRVRSNDGLSLDRLSL